MNISEINLREQIETLLSEGSAGARRREATAFDELAGPFGKSLVLFGAGGLGRRTLAGLRKLGIEPLAFADSSAADLGMVVDGCPVLSPEAAARRYHDRATFVTTIWGAVSPSIMAGRRQSVTRNK